MPMPRLTVGSRVDMQVRPVRLKGSRSAAPSSPHAARIWGHSSRCFAFGGVSPCIISGQRGSDCIQTSRSLHAHRPQPPELNQ